MSCTVTEDGPCRRTLRFSIERDRIDREVSSRLGELARTTRLKGFRPGKAPAALVEKLHGESIREEVRRKLMGEAFSEAIREHDIHPVGDPEMNLAALDDEGDGPFTFEFAVEVAPSFELRLPERFEVSVTLPDVDDAMIDAEVRRLRERRAELEDAPDGARAGLDDILEGTIVYRHGEVELPPRAGRSALLRHDLVDGFRVPGLADRLEGTCVGERVDVDVTLPEHFEPQEHAGAEATMSFTVERIRRLALPPLDEAFLEAVGVPSVDELRERIRAALERERGRARDAQVDRAIERRLVESHALELPERLLAKSIDGRVHEHAHRLMEQQGLSSEDGHSRAEEERQQIAEATTRGLTLAFVTSRIAQTHGLLASVEEAVEQVKLMARAEKQDEGETLRSAVEQGWLSDVQEQLTRDKVREWLRQRAEVTVEAPPAGEADETEEGNSNDPEQESEAS